MKIDVLEPQLASRLRNHGITTIVLHATDGSSVDGSITWLREKGNSYHYIIDRGGEITKCVANSREAFHAGLSVGPNGSRVNRYSIGISFANWQSQNEDITNAQVSACTALVKQLALVYSGINFLTTHYAVSPKRKTDPSKIAKAEIIAMAKAAGLEVWGI